jgi:CheY-like chemotaxis protein
VVHGVHHNRKGRPRFEPWRAIVSREHTVCSILIVDDHTDSREAIAELVRDAGHDSSEAANGREALDWLDGQSELPCLILLDLRMPTMDGWDFLRALNEVPRLSSIPVIVISVTIHEDAPTPVLPAKAFWSKPPDAERIASVHQYCAKHRDVKTKTTVD